MKKLAITILTMLMILSLLGCAGTKKTSGSDTPVSDPYTSPETSTTDAVNNSTDETDQNQETEQSYDNVPRTNVPMYPNSQQVHSGKDQIIYVTSDSGDKVNTFYKNHPNLNYVPGSGVAQTGYYVYTTPLTNLLQGFSTDPEIIRQQMDEINVYISESGGLFAITICDSAVDAQLKESTVGPIFSELPNDKTIILYAVLDEQ